MLAFFPCLDMSSIPHGTLCAPLFGLQGGGVYVYGVANFESCNIHDNTATSVRLHL